MTARSGRRLRLRLKKGQARLIAWLGFPLFAIVVFVLAFTLSLPLERIKERLERELSQEPGPPVSGSGALGIGIGMDVSIGELAVHLLPLGASADHITLRPRPSVSSASSEPTKPKPMFVDSIAVSIPLAMLLGSRRAADLEVKALGGSIEGGGSIDEVGGSLRGELQQLALARAPALGQLFPLPLGGVLNLKVDLTAPARKPPPLRPGVPPASSASSGPQLDYSKATGQIDFKLGQGVLGDGKAKLSVPGDPFLSQGLTFPRLALGDLGGRLTFDRGRATFSDFHGKSADAEIWLEGYVELRDPLQLSELKLYLRFAPSAALVKREPTFEILNNAMAAGRRSDGALGFAITGLLANPRSRPAKEPPEGMGSRAGLLGQVGKDVGPPLRPQPPLQQLVPSSPSTSFIPPPPPALPPPPPAYQPPPPPPPAAPPPSPPPPPSVPAVGPPPAPQQLPAAPSASHGNSRDSEAPAAGHAGAAMGSGLAVQPTEPTAVDRPSVEN